MAVEQDWIATEMHDVRFYEQTNHLLTLASRGLSMANIALFITLIATFYFLPTQGAYYITSQAGLIKPISALTKQEIQIRVANTRADTKPIKHQ